MRAQVLDAAILALASLAMAPPLAEPTPDCPAERAQAALDRGDLRHRVTTPDELCAALGSPDSEVTGQDGGMALLDLAWPEVEARLGRSSTGTQPFTLRRLVVRGEAMDLAPGGRVVLRDVAELDRLDRFEGLQGLSLVDLDLTDEGVRLAALPFDDRTAWPDAHHLPAGFDPSALLVVGRDPGLGVRRLHARGLDGRGVGVALLDQPLVPDHEAYAAQLARYEPLDVAGVPPQMHGPAVTGIAAAVAPGARLSAWAVPMWSLDATGWARTLDAVVALEPAPPADPRIRVVSISTGTFRNLPGAADWLAAVERAERAGVLVLTCDPASLPYGILRRGAPADPDDPASWTPARWTSDRDVLRVPGAGRAIAGPGGPHHWTWDPEGGMSWGAPWLAGLAAIAFQVSPTLTPADVRALLVSTARPDRTVDPEAFVAAAAAWSAAGAP